jgi:murein DD-endopeptidase MepM/ murein hydrolase activator NlpD
VPPETTAPTSTPEPPPTTEPEPPPTTAPPSSGPESDFICPVAGAVAFSDDFGGGRNHKGNDMFAEMGTSLVAVRSGSVSLDEDPGGGGHMLYLSAGGDMFIYMHLDTYSVGDGEYVSQGQQVGTVGMTGNATAPHLHFEIHPGGGAAVDPYSTISQYC